jgi:hypothetical protein
MAKKQKKPTVFREDRYIGEVQGNILDVYQNSSYNLKLYMIKAKTADGGETVQPLERLLL